MKIIKKIKNNNIIYNVILRNKNFVSRFINVYDYLVNDINCKYAWRCSQKYF